MMTKFNVGDKVRILNVDKIAGAEDYFKNGDITHVMSVDREGCPYLYCNDGDYDDGLFITDRELDYIELIADKPSKSERISLLESQVADLTAKVEALQKRRKPAVALTQAPNERRKAVIERAKAFVAEHTEKTEMAGDYLGVEFGMHVCDVQFIVNIDKRAVTLLAKGVNSGVVRAKAIAKCAPDDVFNADIGKAIALGRALGLDVSEFENAVKPTKVIPGMKVDLDNAGLAEVNEYLRNNGIIVSDTEAQY